MVVGIKAEDSRAVDVVEAGTAVVGTTPLQNVSNFNDWDRSTKSLPY